MNKYLSEVIEANKTLEKKTRLLTEENIILLNKNKELQKRIYELEQRNESLERSKCKQQSMCNSLKSSMLPMGMIFNGLDQIN